MKKNIKIGALIAKANCMLGGQMSKAEKIGIARFMQRIMEEQNTFRGFGIDGQLIVAEEFAEVYKEEQEFIKKDSMLIRDNT
jgi:hypothetical protein